MKVALLWYDDSLADFAAKAQDAAQPYREKSGRRPNRCHVNPASLPGQDNGFSLDGIRVLARITVLPDHFWVGVEERKRSRKRWREPYPCCCPTSSHSWSSTWSAWLAATPRVSTNCPSPG